MTFSKNIVLNEKISNILSQEQIGSLSGVILMNRIALILAPSIKAETTSYNNYQLNQFIKTNFPVLSTIPLNSRHILVEILKDTLNNIWYERVNNNDIHSILFKIVLGIQEEWQSDNQRCSERHSGKLFCYSLIHVYNKNSSPQNKNQCIQYGIFIYYFARPPLWYNINA